MRNLTVKFLVLLIAVVSAVLMFSCQSEEQDFTVTETEQDLPVLKSAINTDYLTDLIEAINSLVDDGVLNRGNANALISKIENALKSIEKGNEGAAGNQISSFLNQIEALINSGTLTIEEADSLKSVLENGKMKGTFIDERDGHEYKWVKIGTQIWMAENLAYGGYPYNGDENNRDIYGSLYYGGDFDYVLCPDGWHVPSDDEWKELELAIGMSSAEIDNFGWRGVDEGAKLKSVSGWSGGGNGTDDFGFNALPAGYIAKDGESYGLGTRTYWWTSTKEPGTHMYDLYYKRMLDTSSDMIYREYDASYHLASIRCIKD